MSDSQPAVSFEGLLAEESFVKRLARRLVTDAATADDVVQETWRRAIDHPPRTRSAIRSWLGAVARNVAAGIGRAEARRRRHESRAATPEAIPATDAIIERLRVQRAVVNAVMRLQEPYLGAILLRFYEDLPPREIARHPGVPVGTVRTRIYRALGCHPRIGRRGGRARVAMMEAA